MEDYLQYIGSVMGAAAISGAAAVATSFYMSTLPPPITPTIDLNKQSKELPGPDKARTSRFYPDGKLLEYCFEDARTLYQIMHRGARVSENGPCLGWRPSKDSSYTFITYNEVLERIKNFSAGLVHLGMKPGQETFVGIYSRNSPEWVITEHACFRQSAILVPLYDTLGPNACSYIINQANIRLVVCDDESKVKNILNEIPNTPQLKQIIAVNKVSDTLIVKAKSLGVQLISFTEVEEAGKLHPCQALLPTPPNVATICYTSGTTGDPKGVVLTHANIIACSSAVILTMGVHGPKATDCLISYLPLAHMFERVCQVLVYMTGGSVGFSQGNIKLLTDDIKTLRPTFIPAVPRLLNRIYDQVQNSVTGSKLKKWIMDMALFSKQAELERHIVTNRSVWDRFVFKPVQESLGGRVRLLVTGSAPLASNVLTFLRCALGCTIIEGYGQTECVAPSTMTLVGDYSVGHVGPPLPCCHVKLVDVPEMEYFAVNGQGEICIKGLNVFQGYLKDPVKTAETIDEEGWLHTGDIGMWMENGALRIVDRKKHIFKLAQGEYIAPEKIENIYLTSQYVAQIFVYGESLKSCLVGVIVPEEKIVKNWCKMNEIEGTWPELCKNKEVRKMILADITDLGQKAGLKSFEQIKDLYLHPELFTIDNGLLTPTLKTKRPDCRKVFMSQIEAMYKHLV
ncbi:long-chain-fatty-acid--CoA ligase 1 [Trichonephila clavata]|uniref:Long-chain-fatty-acid--CoA ligase n=1 Tax=Trichonephila clavata TaxID=2740835 RepID=A0A8X6FUI1_TRICU|nr:long-chain-fatty-acid--CoA ligase 1 [Trichonephila clavata]